MDTLPYELLDAIVDEVPNSTDLAQIRTVNKAFCALVTRRLFRHVTIKSTLKGASAFGEILGRDRVAECIEAITFQGVWTNYHADKPVLDLITDALASSFTRIHELPRLKTLELSFYATRNTWDLLNVQWTILSAISNQSPSPSLTSLTINNLAPLYHPIYDSPLFCGLLRSLTSLSVLTAYDDYFNVESHTSEFVVKFWEEAIQNRMLGSLSHNLTTLRLQGQIYVGLWPPLQFSQANFPALEALSLQKFLFNEDTHVEDFIIRHRKTLRRMWLADCSIGSNVMSEGVSREWSYIWNHFARELKALVLLVVRCNPLDEDGFTTDSSGEDDSLKYAELSWLDLLSYEPWDKPLPFEDGDLLALRELRQVVWSRAAEEQKLEG